MAAVRVKEFVYDAEREVLVAAFQNEREQLAQLEWLFEQKKFAEGLARSEEVLREFPASFHLKFLRYRFLRQLQQNVEALQLLREMHAMSGDNIMVVRELADLNFQLQQYSESLLYYKKLIFLDSFNSQAQERIKWLQEKLETGVSDRLADTKSEFRMDTAAVFSPIAPAAATPVPEAALGAELPPITLDFGEDPGKPPAGNPPAADGSGLHFQTESAADLYLQQGMLREALTIYKNLFEKTGRTAHFQKIQAILQRLRAERSDRVIEQLQRFLQRLQRKGSQIV